MIRIRPGSTNNYLRGGFVIGGMLPGNMLPFAFDIGGVDLGATVQTVRGPWAVLGANLAARRARVADDCGVSAG